MRDSHVLCFAPRTVLQKEYVTEDAADDEDDDDEAQVI